MKENVLSLNDFGMPKVFDENDSAYLLIIRLLLLEPGKFQSHPEMGIGLKQRYRYNNAEDFELSLKNDISTQMAKYLPSLIASNVSIVVKDKILGIIIDVSDGAYVVSYNSENGTIEAGASHILEDLY